MRWQGGPPAGVQREPRHSRGRSQGPGSAPLPPVTPVCPQRWIYHLWGCGNLCRRHTLSFQRKACLDSQVYILDFFPHKSKLITWNIFLDSKGTVVWAHGKFETRKQPKAIEHLFVIQQRMKGKSLTKERGQSLWTNEPSLKKSHVVEQSAASNPAVSVLAIS